MTMLKVGLKLALGTMALVAGFDAAAQTYPSRPVKIIVPATTGGAIDVIARVLADKMTASLGQPVVVENKPGASNNLGTDFVAKSAPDGYTLVIVASSHATNKHLFKNLGWDPVKDFEPIVYTHVVPLLLTVHPSVPAKTVPELIAWIKANPDKAICAHSGTGSSLHMATELFMSMSNTKMQLVPYKGSSAAHPDLLAGRTTMIFDTITAIAPHVKAGSLRGIAVTTTTRSRDVSRDPDDRRIAARLRRRDLGRNTRACRDAEGDRREAERLDQRGAQDGRRAREAPGRGDRDPGRDARAVRQRHQGRSREVGPYREGGRNTGGLGRMAKFWERLRGSQARKGAFLLAVVALMATAARCFRRRGNRRSPTPSASPSTCRCGCCARSIRARSPATSCSSASTRTPEAEFTEPVALWHRHFAAGAARARAREAARGRRRHRAAGAQFDKIVPGLDLAMMRGLARPQALLGAGLRADGQQQGPHRAGAAELPQHRHRGAARRRPAVARSRRRLAALRTRCVADDGAAVPTLVSQLLRGLGIAAGEGYIDYSLGAPLDYVPIHKIASWDDQRSCARRSRDAIVLIGSLLLRVDRWRLPVLLLAERSGTRRARSAGARAAARVHAARRPRPPAGAAQPPRARACCVRCPTGRSGCSARRRRSSCWCATGPPWSSWARVVVPALRPRGEPRGDRHASRCSCPSRRLLATFWLGLIVRGVFDAHRGGGRARAPAGSRSPAR